jgi:hypothetical protein
MTSLADSLTLIQGKITEFDTATAQLATTQAALVQAQSDLATLLANTALPVATRASEAVLLKATAEVLESDIASQELALSALQKQLIADSTDLQSRLRGELGSKISDATQAVIASLQTDFDVSRIMYPIQQVAAAHRDVLALRAIENSLTMHRPGDAEYITFARNAGGILTAIG